MTVTMYLADEKQLRKADVEAASGHGFISVFADLFKSLKNMPPVMYRVLAVTAVTWVRPCH
jgi:solute carrier family 45 protein 1/2/4